MMCGDGIAVTAGGVCACTFWHSLKFSAFGLNVAVVHITTKEKLFAIFNDFETVQYFCDTMSRQKKGNENDIKREKAVRMRPKKLIF